MAWRRPRMFALHAARDAGFGAITAVGTATTSLANLINERVEEPFVWTDSTDLHAIDIDLGASFVTGIDYVFIPLGHDLATSYIKVEQDTTSAFSTPEELLAETLVPSNGAAILYEFDTASTQRHIRVSFPTTSGAWTITELWLTQEVDPTRGIEQDWGATSQTYPLEFSDGTAIRLEASRQEYELTFRFAGNDDAADLELLESFSEYVSTHRPFVLEPPWTSSFIGIYKLIEQTRIEGESALPPDRGVTIRRFEFSMQEFLL